MKEYISRQEAINAVISGVALQSVPILKSVYILQFTCQEGDDYIQAFFTYEDAYAAMIGDLEEEIEEVTKSGFPFRRFDNNYSAELYCPNMDIYCGWQIIKTPIR